MFGVRQGDGSQLNDPTHANPPGCEAVPLSALPKTFQTQIFPHEAHPNTHWRAPLRVYRLPEEVHLQVPPQHSHDLSLQ